MQISTYVSGALQNHLQVWGEKCAKFYQGDWKCPDRFAAEGVTFRVL